jgi:rubrerythrin
MNEQFNELLLQALETEMGGVQVYQAALNWVVNDDLKKEWEKYLEQTNRHVEVLRDLCETFGLDPEDETPGRQVVRHLGKSLVKAIKMSMESGEPEAAELFACERRVLAETKDHLNWELLSQCAEKAKGEKARALKEACENIEEEEDEHLYHSKGWRGR